MNKCNIRCGAYHGGDLNGVTIIWLMNDAHLIMNEIFTFLSTHKRIGTADAAIRALCDDVELALKLWNKFFVMMNKRDPDNKQYDETQQAIDLTIDQMH